MQHTHVIYHILSSPLSLDGKLDLWAVEVLTELVTHCNQLSSEWAEEKKKSLHRTDLVNSQNEFL